MIYILISETNKKNCLILTTSMAGMVRNPAKIMDKKTKLAGWLFPIPTRWCGVCGNSLDSSFVLIFHTVSRMKHGRMLQSFPQVWKRLNLMLENLDWRVREALDEWWETPHTAWRLYLQSKVFGRLEHQRGVEIFLCQKKIKDTTKYPKACASWVN